jgi:hypothetical protein
MGKYLRDIDIRVPSQSIEAKKWGTSTNFLAILYFACLPRVETSGISKVIIQANKILPAKKLENMVDVLQLNKLFDFEAYFAADKETKKRIALEFLQDGLLEVATIRGWNTNPFHEAYKAVLAKNFVNYCSWTKPVTSPDRKYKAEVWCNYDSDKAEIFISIYHRKELVSKTLVTTVEPGDVWIRRATAKLEWISVNKVKLTSGDGKQSWEAVLP